MPMTNQRPISSTIRLAVTCLILAIGMRTWLVMGLIEPVVVSGSSMMPTLRGDFVTPSCPHCNHQFEVGVDFAFSAEQMQCPRCRRGEILFSGLEVQRGDKLWIDRTAFEWRYPRRWETVVARSPHNAEELCVKRVVGLPGELVELRDGKVFIDGKVAHKSLEPQQALRQLVHRESSSAQRWQPDDAKAWTLSGSTWEFASAHEAKQTSWLRYQHPQNLPITDDVPNNVGVTRKLNYVDEFMLTADLRVNGEGKLHFLLKDGTTTAQLRILLPEGIVEVITAEDQTTKLNMTEELTKRMRNEQVTVELSNFDQQLRLVIDGKLVLNRTWPNGKAVGTSQPFAVGVQAVDITLENVRVYRDVYYGKRPVGAAREGNTSWQLESDEFFLLGNNPPISADSRLWGPVSGKLIIGMPL